MYFYLTACRFSGRSSVSLWINHLSVQLIVGILAFIIGLLTLLLPETLGEPLTTTLEEAESLGRGPGKKTSNPSDKDAEEGMALNQNEAKA